MEHQYEQPSHRTIVYFDELAIARCPKCEWDSDPRSAESAARVALWAHTIDNHTPPPEPDKKPEGKSGQVIAAHVAKKKTDEQTSR